FPVGGLGSSVTARSLTASGRIPRAPILMVQSQYPENVHGASKAHFACAPMGSVFRGLAQIIFCGALERHPGLRVSFGECNVGWLPYFVEWMDRQERERPPDPTAQLSLKPSEYFARQITVSFEEDVVGARLIGQPWAHLADSAVWGADYP